MTIAIKITDAAQNFADKCDVRVKGEKTTLSVGVRAVTYTKEEDGTIRIIEMCEPSYIRMVKYPASFDYSLGDISSYKTNVAGLMLKLDIDQVRLGEEMIKFETEVKVTSSKYDPTTLIGLMSGLTYDAL